MADKKGSNTGRGVPKNESVNPDTSKKSVNPPSFGQASSNPGTMQSKPITPPSPKTPNKKP